MKEDLRKQQKKDADKMATKLEQENQQQEMELRKHMDGDRDKVLRELKNKQAAELAARPDLSQDQINAVSSSTV